MVKKLAPNALWHNFFRSQDDWIEEAVKMCRENRLFKGFTPPIVRWLVAKIASADGHA